MEVVKTMRAYRPKNHFVPKIYEPESPIYQQSQRSTGVSLFEEDDDGEGEEPGADKNQRNEREPELKMSEAVDNF